MNLSNDTKNKINIESNRIIYDTKANLIKISNDSKNEMFNISNTLIEQQKQAKDKLRYLKSIIYIIKLRHLINLARKNINIAII